MKTALVSQRFQTWDGPILSRRRPAFTLIEIMVVVGILGVILAMGAPPFFRILQKEGMRKVLSDVQDVFSNARAQAILKGTTTEVVFHPLERRLEVAGSGSGTERQVLAAQLPEDLVIEMLDINFLEYNKSEVARVRFFQDGTSDEMTLILHSLQPGGSEQDRWRAISLEVTTGLARVETDAHKFGR
jgi:prepilin-type N-terminal cleavage/methylation domain-containing protein